VSRIIISGEGHTSAFWQKEMADELWSNHILPIDGLCSHARISVMRKTLQWKLQDKDFHLLGPIPLHGLCPVDLPGKPEGYPGMPAGSTDQAVSPGHPGQGIKEHSGQCKSGKGLEDLCRFCPSSDNQGKEALHRRVLRSGTGSDGVCARHDHDRSLSFALFLGRVQEAQRSDQAPHTPGSERKHTDSSNRHPWQGSRSEHPRSAYHRGRSHLHHGPGLYRLYQTSCNTSGRSLFRYQGQRQLPVQAPLFSASGQSYGNAVRSDYHHQEFLCPEGLPRKASPDTILRQGQQLTHCVSDQQLHPAGTDHSRVVQLPLADRTVLQMDQAAFPDQGFLWRIRECHEDPDLDRHLGLYAGGNRQEIPENRQQSLYDPTGFERHALREDANYTCTYRFKWSRFRDGSQQPANFIRLTLGQ